MSCQNLKKKTKTLTTYEWNCSKNSQYPNLKSWSQFYPHFTNVRIWKNLTPLERTPINYNIYLLCIHGQSECVFSRHFSMNIAIKNQQIFQIELGDETFFFTIYNLYNTCNKQNQCKNYACNSPTTMTLYN